MGSSSNLPANTRAMPNDPMSPLVQGVGGLFSASRGDGALNTTWGARSVWDWDDGSPFVCEMSINGHRRVDLNFFPGLPPIYYDEDMPGDGGRLVRNALLHVASGALAATPSPVNFPDTGTFVTSAPITVTFGNQGQARTVTALAIGGANPGDFQISTQPPLPLTVAGMGSFTVEVSFRPTAAGQRAGTLDVTVQGEPRPVSVPLSGKALPSSVVANPATLRLSTTGLGVPVTGDVTLENVGLGSVTITSASVTQNPQEFSLVNAAMLLPATLAAGAQLPLTVQFSPTVSGQRMGQVSFNTSDPGNPTIQVSLVGSSGAPMITVDTQTAIFPSVNLGGRSQTQQIHITNAGLSDLNVTDISIGGMNPGDFPVDKMALPGRIAPGLTAAFGVTFVPTAAGVRSAVVTITSDDPMSPSKAVNVQGTATTAALDVSTAMLAFGQVDVGATSAAQMVTISNTGNGTLQVQGLNKAGNDPQAFVVTGMAAPFNLTGGATAMVGVACKPSRAGAFAATLSVITDVGTNVVTLDCQGVTRIIQVSPPSIDFGAVPVGQSATAVKVTLSNNGSGDLRVTGISLGGADAASFSLANGPTVPAVIAANAQVTFDVGFTARAAGAATATITITSDDTAGGGTKTVSLAGNGARVGFQVTPSTVDFGTVPVGQAATPASVTLRNTGDVPVQVSSIAIDGNEAAQFSVDRGGPLSVGAMATAVVKVTYTPTSLGSAQATLTITPVGSAPVDVTLTGSGANPLRVTPTNLELGDVAIGQASSPATVTIQNTGKGAITIARIDNSNAEFVLMNATAPLQVAPSATIKFDVIFSPTKAGSAVAQIGLVLQGQQSPIVTIRATGAGIDPATGMDPGGGCSVARTTPAPGAGALSLALLAALALLLRRRTRLAADRPRD